MQNSAFLEKISGRTTETQIPWKWAGEDIQERCVSEKDRNFENPYTVDESRHVARQPRAPADEPLLRTR